MIKSELILRVGAQNPHPYNRDVEKVVNSIFDEIEAALVRRDRVELRGFGVFTLKTRHARPGRNPKTGSKSASQKRSILYLEQALRYAVGLTASQGAG
jgi:integration host factor subunit beta